ncbi:MAG TPA: 6-bladed beta-propeller [Blastocatellia bacterium]|nr:6-bladed beta-propeller [Blastocatellia bacterium]
MDRTFVCPSCGAPLAYTNNPAVICSFCGNTVSAPQEWRPAIPNQYAHPSRPSTRAAPILVAIGAAALCGALIVILLAARPRHTPVPVPRPAPTPIASPNNPLPAPEASGLGTAILTFGHEGIGPGLFKDARCVAVDSSGRIYVGEYGERRIQVFDSTGKFTTQWMVRPEIAVHELAADRQGNVYVEGGGSIWRFEGSTGKELGHMDYPGGSWFNDVVATADGGLVASHFVSGDDIIRFDRNGRTSLVIRKAVSTQSDRPEPQVHIAVDGLGNIYALSMFSNAVYKFSTDGKFISKFGSAGDEPGQFRAPLSIAVDGQGRVYVGDFKGVQAFDANGRYLGILKHTGVPLGMVVDDNNSLFVAARDHVVKIALKDR